MENLEFYFPANSVNIYLFFISFEKLCFINFGKMCKNEKSKYQKKYFP